jgi:DNA-binding NtrC family response regulator
MKATILLVDDNPNLCDALGQTLRWKGYDVALATNGQEALNAIRSTGFDLVLLDLGASVTKGWDTLSHPVTVSLSLPPIVIKGHPDQQCLATLKGVAAVLEKPVETPLVLEVIEVALAQRSGTSGNTTKREWP